MRLKLLDWIYHCTKVCQTEDRNVFFKAVQIVDQYYARVPSVPLADSLTDEVVDKKDLQLTAVTALLMASKLIDLKSLKMNFCVQTLGHKKYNSDQILKKES